MEDAILKFDYLHTLLRQLPEVIVGKDGKEHGLKIWKHQNRFFAGYPPEIAGQTSREETLDLIEPVENLVREVARRKAS